MITIKHLSKRSLGAATVVAAGATLALSLGLGASAAGASPVTTASAASSHSFTFALVPSPGIRACLPHIGGVVRITPGSENDLMQVTIFGAPRNAEFDLFVIQQPNKPFGVSWYQTDVNANSHGVGSASVRGIFDRETFSVSPGGTTTFAPTHQYHLGLWFNDPKLPFRLGCEPGAPAPVVTPFNGEQHAGIQALNTAEFPVNAGPLSHVHR
jgi:hypothetical protein